MSINDSDSFASYANKINAISGQGSTSAVAQPRLWACLNATDKDISNVSSIANTLNLSQPRRKELNAWKNSDRPGYVVILSNLGEFRALYNFNYPSDITDSVIPQVQFINY